ncbi:MAG TPA: SLOG family protein [Candidatus Cryosericum sp.]|nr:SLOG family protein [Candidatus Cryosericum sp.]
MQNLSEFDGSPLRACCFTGHRPEALPDRGNEDKRGMRELCGLLEAAVFRAADEGISLFYTGGARGFDTLAAETVLRLGETNPEVRLFLSLPGRDQTEGWPEGDRLRYEAILSAAGERVWYAADVCSPDSMRKRNRYLVDHSTRCIAYLKRLHGGTLYTVNYALENDVPVENLALFMPRA